MKLKKIIASGLFWGLFMFLLMDIILPIINKENITEIRILMLRFLFWCVAGIIGSIIQEKLFKNNKNELKSKLEELDHGTDDIDYLADNEPESF